MKRYLRTARTGLLVIVIICFVALAAPFALRTYAFTGPTSTELATTLHRIDLGPEALTAAGVSANDAADVVEDAFLHLADYQDELDAADGAFAATKRNHNALVRIVRAGRASNEQIDDLGQARIDFATTRSMRQGRLNGALDAAAAELSGVQRSLLDKIRLNRGWRLPVEYLTVDRTEPEWVALRDALANERIAAKLDEEPDPEAQALLLDVRSDPTVGAARANLDANLGAVTIAWEAALDR